MQSRKAGQNWIASLPLAMTRSKSLPPRFCASHLPLSPEGRGSRTNEVSEAGRGTPLRPPHPLASLATSPRRGEVKVV